MKEVIHTGLVPMRLDDSDIIDIGTTILLVDVYAFGDTLERICKVYATVVAGKLNAGEMNIPDC